MTVDLEKLHKAHDEAIDTLLAISRGGVAAKVTTATPRAFPAMKVLPVTTFFFHNPWAMWGSKVKVRVGAGGVTVGDCVVEDEDGAAVRSGLLAYQGIALDSASEGADVVVWITGHS